jgi:hypothetical protein
VHVLALKSCVIQQLAHTGDLCNPWPIFLNFEKTKPPNAAHPVGAGAAEVYYELSLDAACDEEVRRGSYGVRA